jgi:hypothetical protein
VLIGASGVLNTACLDTELHFIDRFVPTTIKDVSERIRCCVSTMRRFQALACLEYLEWEVQDRAASTCQETSARHHLQLVSPRPKTFLLPRLGASAKNPQMFLPGSLRSGGSTMSSATLTQILRHHCHREQRSQRSHRPDLRLY